MFYHIVADTSLWKIVVIGSILSLITFYFWNNINNNSFKGTPLCRSNFYTSKATTFRKMFMSDITLAVVLHQFYCHTKISVISETKYYLYNTYTYLLHQTSTWCPGLKCSWAISAGMSQWRTPVLELELTSRLLPTVCGCYISRIGRECPLLADIWAPTTCDNEGVKFVARNPKSFSRTAKIQTNVRTGGTLFACFLTLWLNKQCKKYKSSKDESRKYITFKPIENLYGELMWRTTSWLVISNSNTENHCFSQT